MAIKFDSDRIKTWFYDDNWSKYYNKHLSYFKLDDDQQYICWFSILAPRKCMVSGKLWNVVKTTSFQAAIQMEAKECYY